MAEKKLKILKKIDQHVTSKCESKKERRKEFRQSGIQGWNHWEDCQNKLQSAVGFGWTEGW